MNDFVRLVVLGSSYRATISVPSNEPLSQSIPDIVELISEPKNLTGHTLVTRLGEEIDVTLTPLDQQLRSGTVLRLLPITAAPQPPEVAEVSDAIIEYFEGNKTGWNATNRFTLGAIVLAITTLLILSFPDIPSWVPVSLIGASFITASALSWLISTKAGLFAASVGFGAIPSAFGSLSLLNPEIPPSLVLPLAIATAWLLIGAAATKQALLGAITALLFSAVQISLSLLGLNAEQTASVIAVLVILALGILPTLALNISGVTKLDYEAMEGEKINRLGTLQRTAQAYKSFSWAIYAIASYGCIALISLLSVANIWANLLATALVLVMLLRTRITPFAYQSWALWIGAIIGLVVGALSNTVFYTPLIASILGTIALATILLTTIRPNKASRIRLRRTGDIIETLATIAALPLTLGIFNIYAQLLEVF